MIEEEASASSPERASKEACERLQFYNTHYDTLYFVGLGASPKPLVLGSKPLKCRFCGGTPPERTFKKTAHAVSELLGNKLIRTRYECDQCNDRFKVFEDDLGKVTLPFRNTGVVAGKRRVPTLVSRSGKSRIKFALDKPVFSFRIDDDDAKFDLAAGTIEFTYLQQPYRPLGAYKAICKAAIALLSEAELINFPELLEWLLQPDLATHRVYSTGLHICLTSFVPAFRPFFSPVLVLLRRKATTDVPYLSFFIAFGNVSYQIFPPCPVSDKHFMGTQPQLVRYPHLFDLQPWHAMLPITYGYHEWSSSTRDGGPKTLHWRFDPQQLNEPGVTATPPAA